jgi:hypothetical protein
MTRSNNNKPAMYNNEIQIMTDTKLSSDTDIISLYGGLAIGDTMDSKVVRIKLPIGAGIHNIVAKMCASISDRRFVYVTPLVELDRQFTEIVTRQGGQQNTVSISYHTFNQRREEYTNDKTVLIFEESQFKRMKFDIQELSTTCKQIILLCH